MLLATPLTAGCGLFPSVSQFVGEPSANVPCDFGAPSYLKAPAPVTSAAFGTTIAIDGSTLIVVAPQELPVVAPVPESQDPAMGCMHRAASPLPPSGAIYSFSRDPDSWGSRPIKLEGASMVAGAAAGPSDGPPIIKDDNFTLISAAVNDSWLAVGLAGDAGSSGLRGSVRLFARTTSGFAEMVPPLVEEESESLGLFGYSVALSG
jgi:hypothetical protein